MSQSFHKLEWDSDFLNFTVGKINGEIIHPPEGKDIEMLMKENEAKLAYYSSPKQLPQTVQQSKELDYVLVDRKIVYSKPIHSELQIDPSILAIAKDTPDNKLSKLAIQSGEFSRFNKDERIEQRKFEELYELWMKHSLNKTIAKEVLAYHSGSEIAGIVTLGEKNNRADIGIIAVDHSFRGRGIGRSLMQSAEKHFSNMGYTTIQVVTQADNTPACKLYEACGYSVEKSDFFYHIWRK